MALAPGLYFPGRDKGIIPTSLPRLLKGWGGGSYACRICAGSSGYNRKQTPCSCTQLQLLPREFVDAFSFSFISIRNSPLAIRHHVESIDGLDSGRKTVRGREDWDLKAVYLASSLAVRNPGGW
jgi:hypothetical protein